MWTYKAPDAGVSCAKIDRLTRAMTEPLRAGLSEIMTRKVAADIAHADPVDLDGDGSADCLVSVHNPKIAVSSAPDKDCSPGALNTTPAMTEQIRMEATEILRLEDEVRRQVQEPDQATSR